MFHAVFLHAYLFLILLAILEGPMLAIACGVTAGLGILNPFIAYGILIGGQFGSRSDVLLDRGLGCDAPIRTPLCDAHQSYQREFSATPRRRDPG
jgi:hypothetical protein